MNRPRHVGPGFATWLQDRGGAWKLSAWHWVIVVVVAALLFGSGLPDAAAASAVRAILRAERADTDTHRPTG